MHAGGLSERLGSRVLLKREDLNPTHSFYVRGAYNRLAHAKRAGCTGVVTVRIAPLSDRRKPRALAVRGHQPLWRASRTHDA